INKPRFDIEPGLVRFFNNSEFTYGAISRGGLINSCSIAGIGPLLDRIDLYIEVPGVLHKEQGSC
ncbi:MAG: hypothetical protein ACSLFC_06785, partial [Desulfuromonadales bacterium]